MLFDLYVHEAGWLQRLDPRSKLALLFLGAILFITATNAAELLLMTALLHLILWSSRVPWARMRWVLVQLRLVLLVIVLLFPWMANEPGVTLLDGGLFEVTSGDILAALATALRLWSMSLLVMSLLFTTKQAELVRGLVRLGLPYRWGLTLAIALRYIPSLTQQIEHIQEAQQARGWDTTRGDVLKRLRGLAPLFVALTIHVFRTVDTLTMAMMARGVGRSSPRTVRNPLRMARQDWIVLAMAAFVMVAWLVFVLL